ncbi:hypothetical protein BKA04_000274 [Cryobacterium mesophilum]|uniref:Cell division protein FtsL n=1 Tax=Terrimesophilobacter mesophilus TaxID=433647 RepID=A0A4R8V8X0_9MICO|nr:hypothetical protein [Terrimesophilobacter mesophilus]MBB5632051.1 hypothetical protein [Terrimesophilobacter mesophilus]TFB78935.1 hypothetical protein E3N84_01920 [Terrimesophilobacter mesophilus]
MSAVAASTARPERREDAGPRRRLDVVSTREQKRSRPKAVYALVTVGGLFAILVAQLLLSIVVSDGAYQISSLQQQQRELARDEQSLTEQLHVLESPQHLAANAQALGMVTNSSMAYLRLSDGKVLGKPVAATASSGIRHGKDGSPLIPNELLNGVALTPVSAVVDTDAAAGAPGTPDAPGSVASDGAGLPSPNTR